MERWQKILQKSLTKPEQIAKKFNLPLSEIQQVNKSFKTRITPHFAALIKENGDALYRQVIPDKNELLEGDSDEDPLGEDGDSPVHNIVHRYPDRVLFLISHVCASYCRFCTRKRKVGDASKISWKYVDEGIEYISNHSEIRDVILSGGDPLLLSDDKIEYVLRKLRDIPHIDIIRIHTRVLAFLPQRITAKLVKMLKKYHPLFMNVHFNHPDELHPMAVKALNRLSDSGIPLGSQTVLLKGVNDDPIIMKKLMQKLLKARVKPYYIYQADRVFGTDHFRTSVERGLEIMENLRGWTSGLANPYYVIDAPGGGGKIPLLPNYVIRLTDDEVVLRNYKGKMFRYKQSDNEQIKVEELIGENLDLSLV